MWTINYFNKYYKYPMFNIFERPQITSDEIANKIDNL